MPYIGNQPAEQFTSFATQTFSVSATTSYTLDHAVTNENEIALFVNNVRQQPGSGKAYTATGTALTLSAATASTDTMYCVFLGRALQTVNPATNSITAAMVSNDLISGKDALASEPADTDEFLVSDAGTLKRIDYSLIKGGGITSACQFRLTANKTGDADVTSNYEEVDTDGYGGIGSAVTESSGIFTFPSTGIYLILLQAYIFISQNGDSSASLELKTTTDNSNYDVATRATTGELAANGTPNYTVYGQFMFDVTNTSTHKVKFTTSSFETGGSTPTTLYGQTGENATSITFLRLGDT